MYAIIETGGKQYQVREGDEIFIEKLGADADETVIFDKVIAIGKDGGGIDAGTPYVKNAEVEATVVKNGKGKKINIFTYRRKQGSSYSRQGHRQPYTKVRIDSVRDSAAAAKPKPKPKPEQKKDDSLKNITAERIAKSMGNE